MDGRELRHQLEDLTQEIVIEQLWQDREYLGMSGVWRCSAELYDHLINGAYEPSRDHSRNIYEANLHVSDMIQRLRALGLVKVCEELEMFDGRVRGHPHGILSGDGWLFHVKAVSAAIFAEVKKNNRALQRDYEQFQMYLLASDVERIVVIYKCRDNGEVRPVVVWTHPGTQDRLVEKVGLILDGVDAGERPACECGRHQ